MTQRRPSFTAAEAASARRDDEMTPMTREHPRWEEFCARLEGPEGCDFRSDCERGVGDTWYCASSNPEFPEMAHTLSRSILMKMGLSHEEIAASLAYFKEHGGYCDCEVLMNVDRQ
jgi:hypothetical protein